MTIGQKIDHAIGLEVDQHGAVTLASAPRPIINPKNERGQPRVFMIGAQDPEHCTGAHRYAEPLNQPHGGFTAERQVDTSLYVTKADCSSRACAVDLFGLLCEDALRATLVGAPQLPNLQTDPHRPTLPR